MKFDTVIIGGGLSGLTCGIRLLQQGKRCVIISSGQSALHFSSGSFDLLNTLPNGDQVTNPLQVIEQLAQLSPNHPYVKLGAAQFEALAAQAKDFMLGIGVHVQGDAQKNHNRITPMGTLNPTWLTLADYASVADDKALPWRSVAIFNPIGFLDFYPKFVADEFAKLGTESEIHLFNLPDIDLLRRNPSEMRSTNIARVLDKKTNFDELCHILKDGSQNSEAIFFSACIGLDDSELLERLKKAVGKPIFLIPTLPPSIVGIRTQQYLHDYFVRLGGTYMLGDSIQKADVENNRVMRVYSYNHGDIPFTGDNFVLATGSYFSQGLIAAQDRVYEPVLDLDVSYLSNREEWYNVNIFEKQNYQGFGVKTDHSFKGMHKSKPFDNLYVSGAILEGFNPIKEGSGAGVSILSALHIANSILSK